MFKVLKNLTNALYYHSLLVAELTDGLQEYNLNAKDYNKILTEYNKVMSKLIALSEQESSKKSTIKDNSWIKAEPGAYPILGQHVFVIWKSSIMPASLRPPVNAAKWARWMENGGVLYWKDIGELPKLWELSHDKS